MKVYIVVTSSNEPATIGKAVEQIICPNVDKSKELWPSLQLIVVAPDQPTLKVAEKVCQEYRFENVRLVKDSGQGKPTALNIAVETITKGGVGITQDDLLILTDGDVYLENNAIKNLLNVIARPQAEAIPSRLLRFARDDNRIGGVGGHPVSVDSRQNMFGYFSHLFCEAAHICRLRDRHASLAMTKKVAMTPLSLRPRLGGGSNLVAMTMGVQRHREAEGRGDLHNPVTDVPMSGYLYAIRGDLLSQIFPIPAHIRAEDAYISQEILSLGYKIAYAPDALVYVKFPKTLSDWYKQKTRSLGGNVQLRLLRRFAPRNDTVNDASPSRNITQDLQMMFFPLLFAKSPKEFLWSLLLYPLRLFLWIKIYYNHALKRYKSGAWDRIESSK